MDRDVSIELERKEGERDGRKEPFSRQIARRRGFSSRRADEPGSSRGGTRAQKNQNRVVHIRVDEYPRIRGEIAGYALPCDTHTHTVSEFGGVAFAHNTVAGRTVGVELFASPCKRLRGCRHLQPSTGSPLTDDGRPSKCQRARAIHAGAWNFVFRTGALFRAAPLSPIDRPRKGTLQCRPRRHGVFAHP